MVKSEKEMADRMFKKRSGVIGRKPMSRAQKESLGEVSGWSSRWNDSSRTFDGVRGSMGAEQLSSSIRDTGIDRDICVSQNGKYNFKRRSPQRGMERFLKHASE